MFFTPWDLGVGFAGFYSQKLFGRASFVLSCSLAEIIEVSGCCSPCYEAGVLISDTWLPVSACDGFFACSLAVLLSRSPDTFRLGRARPLVFPPACAGPLPIATALTAGDISCLRSGCFIFKFLSVFCDFSEFFLASEVLVPPLLRPDLMAGMAAGLVFLSSRLRSRTPTAGSFLGVGILELLSSGLLSLS